MKQIISLFFIICMSMKLNAQQFIEKATIEFEVKSNIQKTLGDGDWVEMIKDKIPTFKTAYYNFTFANNKSFYKLDHYDSKSLIIPEWLRSDEEENEWFTDYTTGTYQCKKSIEGTPLNIKDSLTNIEWKLINENTVIAGFNCRKAVGKIFDSVYVFVFYCEEIPISGGPCTITGLPGMIMGMTIPRLYTSWIATKVNVVSVNEAIIKPAASKKIYRKKEFNDLLLDKTKNWGWDENSKARIARFVWSSFL
jgi:GLPGLI family protein